MEIEERVTERERQRAGRVHSFFKWTTTITTAVVTVALVIIWLYFQL